MKLMTTRMLVASMLLMPAMLIAKPVKKKKPVKPAATEDLKSPGAPVTAPPPPVVSEEAVHYDAGYGMAGCGLGSMVLKEDSFMQIFAATLNGTGVQTVGISLGTSNCKPSGKATAMEQKVFIEANLVSLKREAASGKGETLSAFADLLGCQNDQFVSVSQSNFQQIFKAPEAESILQGYKAVLSNQCTRLI